MEKRAIREAYIKYWLENGKKPVSVYLFCQQLGLRESDFYDKFASFGAVEKDIWLSFFDDTVVKLKDDEVYRGYSVREKLLAFYFLWVQQLRENRSFILLQRERFLLPGSHLEKLESFRHAFYEYIRDLIKEGYQSGEIKERKFISD